ncbi:MAG: type VI secretion system tube protein Hcp [Bryobacterales bacterium]|nr:type VI secretion system tube protein Hcp [Bryobacterales bacterium]
MAVDFFLKIDGIDGESQDAKHKNEIELLSWSWGLSQSGTSGYGGGAGAGRVSIQDLNFVKRTDKASPKLMLACCSGEHIKNALLTARKAGKEQQEYYKLKLTDVLVSSYQTGGSGAEEIPTETIAFNFSKYEIEYHEQKPDGTLGGAIKSHWDQKKNVGG